MRNWLPSLGTLELCNIIAIMLNRGFYNRKSDEFQTATVALRSTAALIISMGIFLITGIGTPFLVFI